MKIYVREWLIIVAGLLVMAFLLLLGALSEGWVALLCFLAVAVVYHTWYHHLLSMVRRSMGVDPDIDEDEPYFPG